MIIRGSLRNEGELDGAKDRRKFGFSRKFLDVRVSSEAVKTRERVKSHLIWYREERGQPSDLFVSSFHSEVVGVVEHFVNEFLNPIDVALNLL